MFSWMLFYLWEIRVMSIKSQLAAFIMTKCLLDKLKLHVKWLQIINHYSYTSNIRNGNIKPLYPRTKELQAWLV